MLRCMMNNCLSPSILTADLGHLADEVRTVDEAGAQYIHVDIMDGAFVPSMSFGPPLIKFVREATDKVIDVHMMTTEPYRFIPQCAAAGADIITVHAEACKHLDRTIQTIRENHVMVGVAINPATPLTQLEYILPEVDMVLIMTVNPGYGGQKLIPYTLDKVRDLRQMMNQRGLDIDIEVDGGIHLDNLEDALDSGANIIVAGSAIFNRGDTAENVHKFLDVMDR